MKYAAKLTQCISYIKNNFNVIIILMLVRTILIEIRICEIKLD